MSELAKRVLSGAILITLALVSVAVGGWLFAAVTAAAGAAIIVEWRAMSRALGWGAFGMVGGVLYAAVPIVSLNYIRSVYPADLVGYMVVLWLLCVVWATDIGAYVAGRLIGGPKLAPMISPNKTWAGLIGGVICAYAVASLNGDPRMIWFAMPFAVLSQCGDLFESWMKRRAGVKDSGTLIPGHGGVMDRLDGLVPVASVAGVLVLVGLMP